MAYELARAGYEAFAAHDGSVHPIEWGALPERTRERWRAAVAAILQAHAGVGPTREPGTAEGEDRFG